MHNHKSVNGLIGALICSLALTGLVLQDREWNFDAVCYAYTAHRWLGEPVETAHASAYRDLQAAAPASAVENITGLSEYRIRLANDPSAMEAQISMYANKPIYAAAITVLSRLGMNAVNAQYWVSAAAYGAFSFLLLWALFEAANSAAGLALGLGLLLSAAFLDVGKSATPDAMSAVATFGGFYFLVFRRSYSAAILLLAFSIGIRPNNVVFSLALFAWAAWNEKMRNKRAPLIGLALSPVVYVFVSKLSGAVSWGVLFNHTYVERVTEPSGMNGAVLAGDYFRTLLPALDGANVLHPTAMPLFFAVSVLGALSAKRITWLAEDRLSALVFLGSLWAAMLFHFLSYPMLADRFFLVYYGCITVMAASLVSNSDRLRLT